MAGFLDTSGRRASSALSNLSKFGTRHEDLLLKNSQAIGFIEGQLQSRTSRLNANDELLKFSMAISDTTSQLRTKAIAFFQLDYVVKRERLRDVASNGEIEFILETIVDDMIVYDDEQRFVYPKDLTGKMLYHGDTKEERLNFQEKVLKKYNDNFEKIYSAWGFAEGISAWQYAFQFLVEGHLSFEIIYDNLEKPKEIIGFKELDPASIAPQLQKDAKGKIYLQWLQYDQQTGSTRVLNDSQVIYISYANHFRTKRVSFVERLIRSFNLLRIIEHSKVIWHVMNAPIRLTTTVPIGSKSFQKGQEDVREFLNMFKEDINFNGDTGELNVEGKPNILFYKNYILPVNDQNQQVKIEPLQTPGPNLSGSELLNYFYKKLKMDSKIPYSRWEGQSGMGAFTLNSEGITREEIRYQKFVNRLRSAFQELMIKPWYLQMCLDFPDIADDYKFNNAIGLKFNNDNVFEEMKKNEIEAKRIAAFQAKKGVMKDDGTPYFSTEYLIREELKMNDSEIKSNQSWFDQQADAEEAAAAAAPPPPGGGAPPAGGGAAPAPAGAAAAEGGGEVKDGGETSGEGQL
ncbi:portal vertex protein [uncultured Caudovirales phage]|uniref:Portal vertex protein n=1 Tax=uncultured Caudovirales phage TaxID=2100421 RepID=A0A6J5PWD6_9CAUD|nr:portal vertex protein [uncultured Caudovirales phage]